MDLLFLSIQAENLVFWATDVEIELYKGQKCLIFRWDLTVQDEQQLTERPCNNVKAKNNPAKIQEV